MKAYIQYIEQHFAEHSHKKITIQILELLIYVEKNLDTVSKVRGLFRHPTNHMALHMDTYRNAQAAVFNLTYLIAEVKGCFAQLLAIKDKQTRHLVFNMFLNNINDSPVGCMEGRLRPGLKSAALYFSTGILDLNNLMQAYSTSVDFKISVGNLLDCFGEKVEHGLPVMMNEEVTPLHWGLIHDYVEEILGYDDVLTEWQLFKQELPKPTYTPGRKTNWAHYGFNTETEANRALSYIKSMLPDFQTELSKITIKVSAYQISFRLTEEQQLVLDSGVDLNIKKLRAQLRIKAPRLAPKGDFYFKTLRGDTQNYFHLFMEELLDTTIRYPKRKGPKGQYTVIGDEIFRRNENGLAVYPLKTPQYTADEKAQYTKAQSTSLGFPGFTPVPFGFNIRGDLLPGILLESNNVLLSNRLSMYDGGTVGRSADFNNLTHAKRYRDRKKGLLFTAKDMPALKAAIVQNKDRHNELLARLRWGEEGFQFMTAADTLESRLLSKQYRDTLLSQLKALGKCPLDYTITLCFFTPNKPELMFKEYTEQEQKLDCMLADQIAANDELREKNYKDQCFEFILGLRAERLKELLSNKQFPLVSELLNLGYLHILQFIREKTKTSWADLLDEMLTSLTNEQRLSLFQKNIACRHEDLKEYLFSNIDFEAFKKPFDVKELGLSIAVFEGLAYWVDKLLAFPIKNIEQPVDEKSSTLLHIAVEKGHIEIVQKLLSKHANINAFRKYEITPLLLAVKYGHLEMVQELLSKGAKLVRFYLQIAVQKGYLEIVKELSKGIDINILIAEGFTLLHFAITEGYLEMVQDLILRGVNVNIAGKDGVTPLLIAADKGHLEIVKELILNNADVNTARDYGFMPLFFAAKNGHLEVVKALLSKGAITEPSMFPFRNPEWVAKSAGHHDIVAEIQKVAAQQRFQAYQKEMLNREPSYLSEISIFGETYHLSCSVKKKKAAVQDLAPLVGTPITKEQQAELEKNHSEALSDGRLQNIYQDLLKIS